LLAGITPLSETCLPTLEFGVKDPFDLSLYQSLHSSHDDRSNRDGTIGAAFCLGSTLLVKREHVGIFPRLRKSMKNETEIDEKGESFNKRWGKGSPTEKCSIEIVWASGGSKRGLTEERLNFFFVCEVRGGELMKGVIEWGSELVLKMMEKGGDLRWGWELGGGE